MLENNFLCSLVCLSFYFLHILAIKDFFGKAGLFFFFFLNNNIAKALVANFGGTARVQKWNNTLTDAGFPPGKVSLCTNMFLQYPRREITKQWRRSWVLLLSFHIFKYLVRNHCVPPAEGHIPAESLNHGWNIIQAEPEGRGVLLLMVGVKETLHVTCLLFWSGWCQ